MATSKCYYPRPSHRFFSSEQHVTTASDFELDELDLYNTGSDSTSNFSFSDLTISSGRTGTNRKSLGGLDSGSVTSSLPVNVPDWSKILGEESRRRRQISNEEEGDGDEISCGGGTRRVPPHELLANRRMASFSVHEGAGRTLKGRDLSRMRNTIFKIRGIED
ncbi:Protein S40-4 [Cardamine amara subsp. amara]|uniref:Protein S40-4 n=1 Tax=Cardamine amara subsp. amara TaxID=228776 RepID=A0ABD1C374_CARAN